MDKQLYRYGFGAYISLFILSLVFYKERATFLDAAYHLFHIIKDGTPAIQHYRYGAIVTQVLPLAGCKLLLPLGSIMLIYSSCFVLWQALCYWLCGSVLKQYPLALALLLSNILFVTDSFYWPLSELPQGLAMLMVMTALLLSTGAHQGLKLVISAAVMLFAVFFHPLLWIPATFIFLYFAINRAAPASKLIFFGGFVLFFLAFYLRQQLLTAEYDRNAMKGADNFLELFPWTNIATNRVFLRDCLGKFAWIPVSFVAVSSLYIYQRKWLSLLSVIAFSGAYVLLVNTTFSNDKPAGFYMENLYLPLGVMLALPLVFEVLPALQLRRLAFSLFGLIALTALIRMYLAHDTYTTRLNWQRNFLEQHAGEKLLVAATPPMMDTLIMTWGTPYEFWLLSTTERDSTASIVITDNIEGIEYT
ncbi:MAG: hypothetical protein K8F30_00090, partial [Taibaiella sp.]|nr:hypothetical protein [Taibaiella sp.]